MAKATKTIPIFMEVVDDKGGIGVFPIKGQYIFDKDGKKQAVDAMIEITLRTNPELEVGAIYCLVDGITQNPNGWYSANSLKMYQITDDMNLMLTDFDNDEHSQMVSIYRDYLNNGKKMGDSGSEEVEKKVPEKPTLLSMLKSDKKLSCPTIEDDGWYVDNEIWYFLLRQYKRRKKVLMVGNSGTGKTELVLFLANRLGKTCNTFDMAVSNPNKTFCGNLRADNGSTYFQLARFAQEIQKDGLILMDELSRAAPTANNILLPLLDSRRTLYIEEAIDPKDAQVKAHEDAVFWSTANIGFEFIGTSMLDHALLNRFQQVGLNYPPQDKESLLLQKRTGISKKDADAVVSVAQTIRSSDKLSKDVSTRQLLEVGYMIIDGYRIAPAFEFTILQQFERNSVDGGEQAVVKTILSSY